MKKRSAVIYLILFILAIAGLTYVAFWGIGQTKAGSAQNIKQGLDLAGGVSITYQVVGDENPSDEDMDDTINKLQKRVENYSTEAQVYKEGSNRINIEIPGVSDANRILEELGQPGTLYFIAQTDASGNQNYSIAGVDESGITYSLNKTIDEMLADGSIVLDGTQVASATAASTTSDSALKENQYIVELTFTEEGKKAFGDATTKAYANGETIAIYYDGEFVSVPTVQAAITNGQAQITGDFTIDEARNLASTIRIGGLTLDLEEIRSNVVGAQLGSEAISTSLKAGVIGFAIVCIFMIVVYYVPGFASAIALYIYVLLTLLVLNGFNITLTLPGVAGVILAIGMAVDANVIIFARIREELATGKTVQSSVKIGFGKATSAILDGNITTLIAAIVLALKGSGTVKGFAQTLMIGIVLSMFTAMFVTRALLAILYALGFTNEKFYGIAKERKSVDFLGKKAVFFAISLVLILGGIVMLFVNKSTSGDILNYSMEFKGGTSTTVTFTEDYSIERLDSEVVPYIEKITGDGNVQCQKVAGTNEVVIKTRTLTVEEREEMESVLETNYGVDSDSIQSETISATISNEMKSDAVVAVIIATILMLLYIWIRFSDFRFATSAITALLHDVLVVLAFYAVSKTSVGNTFIACMLTIVGYSINATIVIFDRIRENLKEMPKNTDLKDVVNLSITQTLTRSIYTSLTTFIMVFVLYLMGVTSIKEFALPLIVGIVCGGYSSVCITGALWYVMKGGKRSDTKTSAAKKKANA
ncbi:MAG: protein translocase subunit SecD [Lachnospiraceae bacterium]|nr:protein translocase subunit SecD [Lachnospiraceae bacterium]